MQVLRLHARVHCIVSPICKYFTTSIWWGARCVMMWESTLLACHAIQVCSALDRRLLCSLATHAFSFPRIVTLSWVTFCSSQQFFEQDALLLAFLCEICCACAAKFYILLFSKMVLVNASCTGILGQPWWQLRMESVCSYN